MENLDFTAIKHLFKDDRSWLDIGEVKELDVEQKGKFAQATVTLLSSGADVQAQIALQAGKNGVISILPAIGDLVVLLFPMGTEDLSIPPLIISSIPNEDHPIDQRTVKDLALVNSTPNDYVIDSNSRIKLTGKQVHLGKENAENPIVLGDEMTDFSFSLISTIEKLTAALDGVIGQDSATGASITTSPALSLQLQKINTDLENIEQQYLKDDSTNFLSKFVFTERESDK